MTFGKRNTKGVTGQAQRNIPTTANQRAEIIVPGQAPRRCEIVSISDTGAQLSLNSVFGIGSTFELRLGGQTYRARVVRRAPGTLHVAFR
jgi:hypothetical protein